jgi:molecular chaperone IbpA
MTHQLSPRRSFGFRHADNLGDLFSIVQKEFDPFFKHTVGFENTFGDLISLREMGFVAFPPHNIRKHENKYYIDLAVAGMAKEDLKITLEDSLLTVAGKTGAVPEEKGMEYVYKGIAERAFSKAWRLGEHTKVLGADLVDGTLTVELEQVVPEGERLRTIEIK